MSKPVSRVMSLDGHLSRAAVAGSLKQPTRRLTGRHMPPARSCFGWGLHMPRLLPGGRWSLTPPFHPYRRVTAAVYFCCTVPEVAFARRYLASCPVKPGLSSPAPFRLHGSGHLACSKSVTPEYHVFQALSSLFMPYLPRHPSRFSHFLPVSVGPPLVFKKVIYIWNRANRTPLNPAMIPF